MVRSLLLVLFTLFLIPLRYSLADEAIPPLTGPVVDVAAALNSSQKRELEALLRSIYEEKGAQIQLLTVSTTTPETIEQYAVRVIEEWKLGREKVDDSVLLLVAIKDRKVRIEVGYGLEGAIPDALAHRIIQEQIIPQFREGKLFEGIKAGLESIARLVRGENLPPPPRRRSSKESTDSSSFVIVTLFSAAFVGSLLSSVVGRFLGGVLSGILSFAVGLFLINSIVGIGLGIITFFLVLSGITFSGGSGYSGGGGGYRSSSSGSSWSGGGGRSGGGGASGSW